VRELPREELLLLSPEEWDWAGWVRSLETEHSPRKRTLPENLL